MLLSDSLLGGFAAPATYVRRMFFVLSVLLLSGIVIVFRILDLSIEDRTIERFGMSGPVEVSYRADIVDRNGAILASSLPTYSFYVKPYEVKDKDSFISNVLSIFPSLSYKNLSNILDSSKKFVPIKHDISPDEQLAVSEMGVPGVAFVEGKKRVYPHGALFAHMIGYISKEKMKGVSGIERAYDGYLRDSENDDLRLSFDVRVQTVVHNVLSEAVKKHKASGGVGLVADVSNGEVLAAVSLPDFDPHSPYSTDDERYSDTFNKISMGLYEMGSVMKVFTVAAALDSGKVKMDDIYNVHEPFVINGREMRDYYKSPKPELNVQEIFARSSNVGMVRMAEVLGVEEQYDYFRSFGLLDEVNVELSEKSMPILPKRWSSSVMYSASYGYGIAVTPLHVVRSGAALMNGGYLRDLSFVVDKHKNADSVIKHETSEKMRYLLRENVKKGTGRGADVPGYQVGGKTGSAEKIYSWGGYNKDMNVVSFFGGFPMSNPRYAIFVMIDEPKRETIASGKVTGGYVVSPVAKSIVSSIVNILNVPPVDES